MLLKDVTSVIYSSRTVDRKKVINFSHRNKEIEVTINSEPVNILRRGSMTYFSIKFSEHERFYEFYNENVVDNFFNLVKDVFSGY